MGCLGVVFDFWHKTAHSLNHRLFGVPKFWTEGVKTDEIDEFRPNLKATAWSLGVAKECSWWMCMACGALREWVYRARVYRKSMRLRDWSPRESCRLLQAPRSFKYRAHCTFPRCNAFFWGGKRLSTNLSFVWAHRPSVVLLSPYRISGGWDFIMGLMNNKIKWTQRQTYCKLNKHFIFVQVCSNISSCINKRLLLTKERDLSSHRII